MHFSKALTRFKKNKSCQSDIFCDLGVELYNGGMKGRHLVRHTLISRIHETESCEGCFGAKKDLLALPHARRSWLQTMGQDCMELT